MESTCTLIVLPFYDTDVYYYCFHASMHTDSLSNGSINTLACTAELSTELGEEQNHYFLSEIKKKGLVDLINSPFNSPSLGQIYSVVDML